MVCVAVGFCVFIALIGCVLVALGLFGLQLSGCGAFARFVAIASLLALSGLILIIAVFGCINSVGSCGSLIVLI